MEFNRQEGQKQNIYPVRDVFDIINVLTAAKNSQGHGKEVEQLVSKNGIYGGLGNVDATMDGQDFVIYGGVNRKYSLKAIHPDTIIVTYGGVNNDYTVYSTGGNILFVTYGGSKNQYIGGRKITFEQFREEFKDELK